MDKPLVKMELKSCPKCGGKIDVRYREVFGWKWLFFECEACGLRTREFGEEHYYEMVNYWNGGEESELH